VRHQGPAAAVAADVLELDGERLRFDHPLLASAVYAEAPEDRRRELHRQLASVVDDPQERARHLALGTPLPDAAVAASIDTAARAPAARGAHSVAAVLAERAHALTPASGVAAGAGRLVRAADYHLRAGDPGRPRALLVRAVTLTPEGPLRARAYHRLAVVEYLAEGLRSAEEDLVAAAREVGTDRALGAAIERDLAVTLMQGRSVTLARPHSRRALELREGQSDEGLLADTLVVAVMVELLAGNGLRRDFLDRAAGLESSGPARHPGVFDRAFLHATVLKWADDFDAARSRFERLRSAALAREEDGLLPGIDFQLGELECWAGNLDTAARYAREGLIAAKQCGLTAMLALALNLTALVPFDQAAARAYGQIYAATVECGRKLRDRAPWIW
jgi:hypothetical protein